jgi:hypothetical protein
MANGHGPCQWSNRTRRNLLDGVVYDSGCRRCRRGSMDCDINFIQFVCPSPWLLDGSDAGGVGGEAWTCDGQTNRINFIQFVCPSPWLLDGSGCGGVGGEAWTCDGQTNGINFIQFVCPSPWLLGEALRRTDEWDKFYPIRLSVTRVARW